MLLTKPKVAHLRSRASVGHSEGLANMKERSTRASASKSSNTLTATGIVTGTACAGLQHPPWHLARVLLRLPWGTADSVARVESRAWEEVEGRELQQHALAATEAHGSLRSRRVALAPQVLVDRVALRGVLEAALLEVLIFWPALDGLDGLVQIGHDAQRDYSIEGMAWGKIR